MRLCNMMNDMIDDFYLDVDSRACNFIKINQTLMKFIIETKKMIE